MREYRIHALEEMEDGTLRDVELRATVTGKTRLVSLEAIEETAGNPVTVPYETAGSTRTG